MIAAPPVYGFCTGSRRPDALVDQPGEQQRQFAACSSRT